MNKAVAYTRVSTTKQAEEGVSLDAQRAKIKAYAELKDLEIVEYISDEGISGKDGNRPGFKRLIELTNNPDIKAIIVYSLSRFTRSTKDLLVFLDRYVLQPSDPIELHSITENLDTESPTGRFMLKIMGAINELEREQIVERTQMAIDHKKANKEKTGGYIPYGFDLGDDGKTLVINPREQEMIDQIKELRNDGDSFSGIAQELNDRGFRTKLNKEWTHVQIKRILERE